jgi:hypothetical protein
MTNKKIKITTNLTHFSNEKKQALSYDIGKILAEMCLFSVKENANKKCEFDTRYVSNNIKLK